MDITGQRFGMLTAVARIGRGPWGDSLWRFRCDCGNETTTLRGRVKTGNTKSCGCFRLVSSLTHGHTATASGRGTVEYQAWASMIQRCTNPRNRAYARYGGRGISVCERWRGSFEAFLAEMGPRPDGLTLERVDNDGNYEPGNCRWATWAEQAKNKRPRKNSCAANPAKESA